MTTYYNNCAGSYTSYGTHGYQRGVEDYRPQISPLLDILEEYDGLKRMLEDEGEF